MSEKINVVIEFEKFLFSVKIKKEKNQIIIRIPSILKSKIPLDKLEEGKEIELTASSLLKGSGDFIKRFE